MRMSHMRGNSKLIVLVAVILLLAVAGWWVFVRETSVTTPPANQPKPVDTGVEIGGKTTDPKKSNFNNLSESKDHSTFLTAMEVAGLVPLMQSAQKLTFFAPTNTAFGKLPREVLQTLFKSEGKERLKELLNYHIVVGEYQSKDLREGLKLKTIQGERLTFTQKDGTWWINGTVKIETPDIKAINGVVHSVDAVITAPVAP